MCSQEKLAKLVLVISYLYYYDNWRTNKYQNSKTKNQIDIPKSKN